jgi:hypothetical protein
VKGSLLTAYRERLDPATYAAFVSVYEAQLVAELGEHAPYPYAFKRVLLWGSR